MDAPVQAAIVIYEDLVLELGNRVLADLTSVALEAAAQEHFQEPANHEGATEAIDRIAVEINILTGICGTRSPPWLWTEQRPARRERRPAPPAQGPEKQPALDTEEESTHAHRQRDSDHRGRRGRLGSQ